MWVLDQPNKQNCADLYAHWVWKSLHQSILLYPQFWNQDGIETEIPHKIAVVYLGRHHWELAIIVDEMVLNQFPSWCGQENDGIFAIQTRLCVVIFLGSVHKQQLQNPCFHHWWQLWCSTLWSVFNTVSFLKFCGEYLACSFRVHPFQIYYSSYQKYAWNCLIIRFHNSKFANLCRPSSVASHSKWTMHTQAKSIIKIRLFKIIIQVQNLNCNTLRCYDDPRGNLLQEEFFTRNHRHIIRVARCLWISIAICCSIEQRAIRCPWCQHEPRQNNSTTICN